jgi:hypothetical protein
MDTPHPWDVFLRSRLACIAWMLAEGKTPYDIAAILSMDKAHVEELMRANGLAISASPD